MAPDVSAFGDDALDDAIDVADYLPAVSALGMKLLDLPAVLPTAQLWPGWESRERGGEGYDHVTGPTHIIVHHTASSTSFENDWAYCAIGSAVAPVANMVIGRGGEIGVHAAGASNHAGAGRDYWEGIVPDSSMNSRSIGIECANSGVGEVWPAVQLDATVDACARLSIAYRIPVHRIRAHYEWAPDRKIDPAGPARYDRPGDYARRWDMDEFRADVLRRIADIADPPTGDDDGMMMQPPARAAEKQTIPGNSTAVITIPVPPEARSADVTVHVVSGAAERGYLTTRPYNVGGWDDTSIGVYQAAARTSNARRMAIGTDRKLVIGNGGPSAITVDVDVCAWYAS